MFAARLPLRGRQIVLLIPALALWSAQAHAATPASRAHRAPRPAAVAPAAPPVAPVLAPAPAAPTPAPEVESHVAHDVPPRGTDGDEEVPVDWIVKDGRLLRRPNVLSVDASIWPDRFTLGAFWAVPVLPRGFIRHVNDSFDLEFGLLLAALRGDWYWRGADTNWELWPAFGARWNFFLTPRWTTFATFKVAVRIGLPGSQSNWFDVIAGAGASYRLAERAHLRLELNYPQGAVVGLSFPIGAL